jgi:phosphorylcholine metabolism protein LicD
MWYILLAMIVIVVAYIISTNTTENFEPVSKQHTFRGLLAAAKNAFDKLEIPFFLSSGSCLGYARERNFIDHDHDVDIGIFVRDYTPKIIDAFDEEGLQLYKVYGTINNGLKMSFYMPYSSTLYKATLDLYLYDSSGPNYCWISYDRDNKRVEHCVKQFALDEIDFMGMKINIPNPLIDYVEEYYGKNWRIPINDRINCNYMQNIDGVLIDDCSKSFLEKELRPK